jgi:hypothetical protein
MQYLEMLGDGGSKLKFEYSLTQHLANNLIDMYINLPLRNHYHRLASYSMPAKATVLAVWPSILLSHSS